MKIIRSELFRGILTQFLAMGKDMPSKNLSSMLVWLSRCCGFIFEKWRHQIGWIIYLHKNLPLFKLKKSLFVGGKRFVVII